MVEKWSIDEKLVVVIQIACCQPEEFLNLDKINSRQVKKRQNGSNVKILCTKIDSQQKNEDMNQGV